jgi:hypothetical protein
MKMSELAKKVNIKHPIDAHSISINEDAFHHNAYVISLPLDSEPSYVWQMYFEEAVGTSLDFWDRKAMVAGRELKLMTTRNGLEEKLKWLETVVDDTNNRVEEHNRRAKWEKKVKEPERADKDAIREELFRWSTRSR